jgi:phenylacetic acid degradation operon negative regulatory protein
MASRRNTADPLPAPGRRPRLTARSVIASTLLGVRPPQLPTRSLVASAELLGVTAGTARVAMSRMVAVGELEPTSDGYRLAGHLLARQARQLQSRTGPPDAAWDGSWRTALVPAEARPAGERAALRRAMAALRYGELRDGAWLRPDNLPPGTLPAAETVAAAQTIVVVGPLGAGSDPAAVARSLWDLDGWAATADDLLRELRPLQQRLDAEDASALAEGFVVAAAVLRHLQADPLLPPPLLPDAWPGTALRSAEDRFDRAFKAVLRGWLLDHR